MPDASIITTFVILAITVALFIHGRLRIELIAICALLALLVTGVLTPQQALTGFANQATATIAAMFVVSAGLVKTGLVQWLARHLDRLMDRTETRLILVICLVVAVLSAFMINTAVVAIFIPIVVVLAHSRRIPASRVLIPLSYASQFGGVCTLVGTSTNMLVNGIAIGQDLRPFGFFEFAPLGLVMVVAGTLYLLATSRWLLPRRKGEPEQVDKYRLDDYLAELQVLGNSPLAGKTWEQGRVSRDTGIELSNLIREGKAVSRPVRTRIRPGDLLLLHGHIERIVAMEQKYGLELLKNVRVRDQQLRSDETQLVEVLIPPGSNLIGRTLATSDFFRRYRASILAMQRRGHVLRDRLADIELSSGDTLLLQGHKDDVVRLMNSAHAVVTNELTELYFRKDRAIAAVLLTVALVVLAAFNIVPIMVAAGIGALGMVLTRCLTIEEVYNAIDWKIIFLLGGIIPLGVAMESSGAVLLLADTVLQPLLEWGPLPLLAATYIVTAILTELMSNNATAAILAPIVIMLAGAINADPRPFLVAITFAASTSFATPVGYQTNTMVYSPGGYRFTDFTRIGLPLNIIFWVLAVILIPLLWPF
ncbi:MAG TPA: SLC13 family permease [Dehalococcoidia bacterium]|nr:SLC13 family permease [Dehalococcoidia bacterium]